MAFPLQITFRNMAPSRIFANRIRELARRLERFSAHIIQCAVVVQQPHQSTTQGVIFEVHVNLTVPGCLIAIRRTHGTDPSHTDPYVALRDAFNAARRKLQDYERQNRDRARLPGPEAAGAQAPQ
jgi:ribosome-associated translation inhibitor RaiA